MSTKHLHFPYSVVTMDVDIMSNEPVMWTTLRGKEGLFPLYTHPPDDTALLRQAYLLCDEINKMPHVRGSINGMAVQLQYALRERLGEKK